MTSVPPPPPPPPPSSDGWQPPLPPQAEVCVRHPGRETGRRCTRCGRPACNDCLVQAAIGSHCVDCVRAAQPPLAQRVRNRTATQQLPVTMTLMVLNLVVFAIGAIASSDQGGYLSGSMTKFHVRWLLWGPFVARGDWWRLVTSGFLHFGLLHVALNMFVLYQLGRLLEPIIGRLRFAMVYGASLFGGAAMVLLISPHDPTAGASGAIFGLLGCAIVYLRARGVNIWQTGLGTMLLINLVLTFTISNISIGGHLGGLIVGGVCGLAFAQPKWKAISKLALYVPPVMTALAIVVAEIAARR